MKREIIHGDEYSVCVAEAIGIHDYGINKARHDREDGSACMQWYGEGGYIHFNYGDRHKVDGPAYYDADTNHYIFYVSDIDITSETNKWLKENKINHLNMNEYEKFLLTVFLSGFIQ